MTLFVFIGWVVLSFVIAGAAYERGRSAFGWFLFSICFSPLIAGLFLLLFPPISLIDDVVLQGSIRAARRDRRIEPSQFAPVHDLLERGQADDQTPGSAIVPERVAEPLPQKRSVGGLAALVFVLMLTVALIAVGVTNIREPRVVESGLQATAVSVQPNNFSAPKSLDYAVIASLPCTKYLNAYGTPEFSPMSLPLIETVSSRGDGLGSGVNIMSFVATECRLHETITIGQAVDNLFDQQRHNRLPRIPIGGATADPEVQASWDAFDKWVHHDGPRPIFPPTVQASTPSTPVSKSFGGRYCTAIARNIEQRNQADRDLVARLPPENPNSPRNPNYKPPTAWKVLSCDETNDPNRVGGMIYIGGGSPWYFEAAKTAYPFASGDAIRLAVCLEAITRQDDILGVPACRSTGDLRRICETPPRVSKCESAPDPRACARKNAVCLAELGR